MIYDYPEYYEIAFSFRDIPAEAAFLQACLDRYGPKGSKHLLEIACGPAPHAGDLIRAGYTYVGLDNNLKMLKYAAEKWKTIIPAPEFVTGDMLAFEIGAPVDFAFVMLGSLYASTPDEIHAHLDAVAAALRPDGLYFLDSCVQFDNPLTHAHNNAIVQTQNGIQVRSTFDIRLLDASRDIYEEVWKLEIDDNGHKQTLERIEQNRALLPEEFCGYIDSRDDFELVGWWRDWDFDKPIKPGLETSRPVVLLRRL